MKNKTLRAKNLQKVDVFFNIRPYLYIILGKIDLKSGQQTKFNPIWQDVRKLTLRAQKNPLQYLGTPKKGEDI